MDTDHVGDLATAIYPARTRPASGLALPQADDQFLAQLANRRSINRVVDRLAADVGVFEVREFHRTELAGNLLGRKAFSQQVDDQIEQLGARHQLFLWAAGHAALARRSLGMLGDVLALGAAVTTDLATDRRGAAVKHSGNGPLAHAAQQTDLDVGAFFETEFVVRHGDTVPERSGVALSFCGRHTTLVSRCDPIRWPILPRTQRICNIMKYSYNHILALSSLAPARCMRTLIEVTHQKTRAALPKNRLHSLTLKNHLLLGKRCTNQPST